MAGDGLEPIDLRGRWVGFYCHRRREMGCFPITAELRQEGARITGEMYDQLTDRTESLEAIIEHYRRDLSRLTRMQLERMIRRYGSEGVAVSTQLPEASDIDGMVKGSRVEFVKTYRGSYLVTLTIGGSPRRSIGRANHKVHYSGGLDRERGCIVGGWAIRVRGPFGRFLPSAARGTFELYRKPS